MNHFLAVLAAKTAWLRHFILARSLRYIKSIKHREERGDYTMADLVNGRLNLSKGKRMYALLMISIASGIVFFACIGVRNLYYNQLIAALGLTNAEYGMLGSVNGIANLIFYLPSGFIADKVNTKTLLVISFLGLGA